MDTQPLTADAYRRALALRDLTDAAHGPHAIQLLAADVVRSLRETWNCDVVVHRASPVVSLEDNYDRLGYPADAAARDARYTRYVAATSVLRTHASAMIPGLLPIVAEAEYSDVLLVCVGVVYRRDRIERLSVGEPHQLDLWRISRRPLDDRDLRQMIDLVLAAGLPEHEYRALPASHPYTLNGLEIEVREETRWVEVGECGLASSRVLQGGGLPAEYGGLAMGLGLDRLLMLRKGIDDIRLLRSSDESRLRCSISPATGPSLHSRPSSVTSRLPFGTTPTPRSSEIGYGSRSPTTPKTSRQSPSSRRRRVPNCHRRPWNASAFSRDRRTCSSDWFSATRPGRSRTPKQTPSATAFTPSSTKAACTSGHVREIRRPRYLGSMTSRAVLFSMMALLPGSVGVL